MSNDLRRIINVYDYVDKEKELEFPYPFQNYSLKQMIDLSERIDILETNHGHSYDILVNGEIANDENDYTSLLCYVSYIGKNIKNYLNVQSQIKTSKFDISKLYSYITYLINNIETCIKMNSKTTPSDIIDYLEQDSDYYDEFKNQLYEIISLFSKQKDLTETSDKLLKLLEVTDEEVEARFEESNETFIINQVDLESMLNPRPYMRVKR